ncbi:hypothetical protein N7451_012409 [Penicillium sp. IBT 35674x]|nr:hypothetical protein N7451_012409 [Penicillium sp. IBT 35674x]
MLRANNVAWHLWPAQPAILSFVANIWEGVQDLTLHSVTFSSDVDSIHCMFCLAEDGDQVDERVILRGVAGKARHRTWFFMLHLSNRDRLGRPLPPAGGTLRREPQNAPKKPSRRIFTTELSTRTSRSHGASLPGQESHLPSQLGPGGVAEHPRRRAQHIVPAGQLDYKESLP